MSHPLGDPETKKLPSGDTYRFFAPEINWFAVETPLGWVPYAKDFDLSGLKGYTPEKFDQVQSINYDDWRREVLQQDELFMKIYTHLPKELVFQRELLVARL